MRYAGIGARLTPPEEMDILEHLAAVLGTKHTLRTGGAEGADTAFMNGCPPLVAEICLPWPKYNSKYKYKEGWYFCHNDIHPDALEIASRFHPAWNRCTPSVRKLFVRNVYVILGPFLDQPVDFVVCWTPKGEAVGGTGHAIRLASYYNIPVYNLGLSHVTAAQILKEVMHG